MANRTRGLIDSATSKVRNNIPPGLELGLRHFWYPILPSSELTSERPLGIRRLGEDLVVWRDRNGHAATFVDRCPHRGARLSVGDMVDGRLQCRYHGLQYDGTGQCRLVPIEAAEDGRQARRLRAHKYPTAEQDGAVWAFLGDPEVFPPGPVPAHDDNPELADPSYVWIVKSMVWNANWLLVHDNTADLFHFPFVHGHIAVHATPDGLRAERLPPLNPIITDHMAEALAFKEYETRPTEKGLYTHRVGAGDDTIDDLEFVLPCNGKVWIPPPGGGHKIRFLQYEMALDEAHAYVLFFIGQRVDSDADREPTREFLDKFAWEIAGKQVFGEDSWIIEYQGDLYDCRANEMTLSTDRHVVQLRKLLRDTYLAQQERLAARAVAEV